jgi:mevalonate kinase
MVEKRQRLAVAKVDQAKEQVQELARKRELIPERIDAIAEFRKQIGEYMMQIQYMLLTMKKSLKQIIASEQADDKRIGMPVFKSIQSEVEMLFHYDSERVIKCVNKELCDW